MVVSFLLVTLRTLSPQRAGTAETVESTTQIILHGNLHLYSMVKLGINFFKHTSKNVSLLVRLSSTKLTLDTSIVLPLSYEMIDCLNKWLIFPWNWD